MSGQRLEITELSIQPTYVKTGDYVSVGAEALFEGIRISGDPMMLVMVRGAAGRDHFLGQSGMRLRSGSGGRRRIASARVTASVPLSQGACEVECTVSNGPWLTRRSARLQVVRGGRPIVPIPDSAINRKHGKHTFGLAVDLEQTGWPLLRFGDAEHRPRGPLMPRDPITRFYSRRIHGVISALRRRLGIDALKLPPTSGGHAYHAVFDAANDRVNVDSKYGLPPARATSRAVCLKEP